MIILDLSAQAVHISNQNLVYAVRPESRNRLNSAYMTSYFVGGAVGSALTSAVWGAAGWHGVCVLGAALAAVVVGLWVAERVRRRPDGGVPAEREPVAAPEAAPSVSP